MDKPGKWEYYLYLVEFAYNNHFQVSVGMNLFEIMYGWKCNTPISWSSHVDRLMLGPELLKNMELTVKHVQNNLKVSKYRKESYEYLKRTTWNFQVGEHVSIKVKPKKSSLRLRKYLKLEHIHCRPIEILEKIGPVAYKLASPPTIKVHNFFHVSILKKYIHDATHVIESNAVQVEPEGELQVEREHILDMRELLL